MKRCGLISAVFLVMAGLMIVAGCETEAQNKALIGGAVGAGAGQLIGGDTKATVIGGAIGAGAGYLWGKSEDNKKAQNTPPPTPSVPAMDANTVTVQVLNSNGSQTPVVLTRNADGTYTGPKGERYTGIPTQEQLKTAYGF